MVRLTDHLDYDSIDKLVIKSAVFKAEIGKLLYNLHVGEFLEGGLEQLSGLRIKGRWGEIR